MKRLCKTVTAIALLCASGAWAVSKGGTLYVKSKETKLFKDAKVGAAVATLKVGDAVTWNGPSEKDKQFHEIVANGKKGFVLMTNLTPNKPAEEIDASTGKPMSAQAFASSGAATKALTPAAIKYAGAKGQGPKISANEAASMVIYAEEHNKAKGTPEAIAAKTKDLGGGK